MPRRFHTLLLLIAFAVPGFPISIQFQGGAGTGSGNFTGVANLGGCSGALLADGVHVLTAAHCVSTVSVSSGETVLTPTGISSLLFFTPAFPNGISDGITGVHFNPLTALWFPGDLAHSLLMYDLALLDLAAPAPLDAAHYNLDLSGIAVANRSAVVLAGWGLGGSPGTSVNGTGGTRRGATNKIAGVYSTADDPFLAGDPIITLADQPIALMWTTPHDTLNVVNTTGLGNAGDSGGPLLYNGNLIGILSYGDLPRSGSIPFGATFSNGYVNLANPGNANWLESQLAPEPATFLIGLGVTTLLVARKRRAKAGRG
jgi:hypothetical protein